LRGAYLSDSYFGCDRLAARRDGYRQRLSRSRAR